MLNEIEIKDLGFSDCKIKMADKALTFSGYASVFNGDDAYGDTVLPGAYAETLKNRPRPIALRWNHYGQIIGKWTNVAEDKIGLKVEGELTKGHSLAEDVGASLRHGSVSGLSIGYRVRDSEEKEVGKGRNLRRIELVEISIVEEPADMSAQISDVKASIYGAKSLKEFEAILREEGRFSWANATALVSGIRSLSPGDRGVKIEASDEAVIEGAFRKALDGFLNDSQEAKAFAALRSIASRISG